MIFTVIFTRRRSLTMDTAMVVVVTVMVVVMVTLTIVIYRCQVSRLWMVSETKRSIWQRYVRETLLRYRLNVLTLWKRPNNIIFTSYVGWVTKSLPPLERVLEATKAVYCFANLILGNTSFAKIKKKITIKICSPGSWTPVESDSL